MIDSDRFSSRVAVHTRENHREQKALRSSEFVGVSFFGVYCFSQYIYELTAFVTSSQHNILFRYQPSIAGANPLVMV